MSSTEGTHCCISWQHIQYLYCQQWGGSTLPREHTVVFPWQQWSYKHGTQFYIICTCTVVFIVHIHVYHTAISVFCRYENLNCVCSFRIWCSFLFCVVMCNVCSSQMYLSTYILWTAATMNWKVSVTQMTENIGLLLLHHVSICTLSIWCFSAERTRVHKSQKKRRQTAGSPLWKPRYYYLAVIVTYWLRDMRKV